MIAVLVVAALAGLAVYLHRRQAGNAQAASVVSDLSGADEASYYQEQLSQLEDAIGGGGQTSTGGLFGSGVPVASGGPVIGSSGDFIAIGNPPISSGPIALPPRSPVAIGNPPISSGPISMPGR